MPVTANEAEEYELPRLRRSQDGSEVGADDALEDIDEQIRLLDGRSRSKADESDSSDIEEDASDGEEGLKRNPRSGRRSSGSQGRLDFAGEEIKGEGSNIEALIARVRSLLHA